MARTRIPAPAPAAVAPSTSRDSDIALAGYTFGTWSLRTANAGVAVCDSY